MKRIQIAQHTSFTPLVFLCIITAAIVAHIMFPIGLIMDALWATVLGVICMLGGPWILMQAHRTRAISPGPKQDPGFVGSGIYRYSRHPQYVGYLVMMIGLAFLLNSLIVMIAPVVAIAFFTLFIIPYQERLLIEQFPDSYPAYQKKVPMWF